MTAITVKYTARHNGLGKNIRGWYIIRYGIVVGCAYKSKEGAKKSALTFIRDLHSQLI